MRPTDFGAPARFTEWRESQEDLFAGLLAATKPVVVLAAPTGLGKGLLNMTYLTATGVRGLYATSTKALQDQLMLDFAPVGLTDVRGMRNYPCLKLRPGLSCDDGPCLRGDKCEFLQKGCLYFDAIREATKAKLALSNYAMVLTNDDLFGARQVLICDEAHDLPDLFTQKMRVSLKTEDFPSLPTGGEITDMVPWIAFALRELPGLKQDLEDLPPGTDEYRHVKALARDLTRLSKIGSETWAWETTSKGVALEPLWPREQAGRLFARAPRVVLSSATITPNLLDRLGVADYDLVTAPSPFPAKLRPVYFLKDSGRLSRGMDPFTKRRWLDAHDEIISGRLDRKGIIHSVSYDRAKDIYYESRFREHMILATSQTNAAAIARFRSAPAPKILISPAIHTGYDFPYDAARYQIISKVPFITPSPIVAAREAADPNYGKARAAASLVQMAGRPVRGPGDWAETFVLDGHFQWLHSSVYRRRLFPASFNETVRVVTHVPPAPPLTGRR